MSVSDDVNFCARPIEECTIPGCSKCHGTICTNCNVGYYWEDGNCIQRTKATFPVTDPDGPAISCQNLGFAGVEASCENCQKYFEHTYGPMAGMECIYVPPAHPALPGSCQTMVQAEKLGSATDQYCGAGLYDEEGWQSAHAPCAVNVLLSYKEALCRWPDPNGFKYWNDRCEDDVEAGTWTGTWEDIKKIMSRKHRNSVEYKQALEDKRVEDNRKAACADDEQTWGCVDEVTTCLSEHANVELVGEDLWESGWNLEDVGR